MKCKYCESENTRLLDETYHKELKADYCCEECGEYFISGDVSSRFPIFDKDSARNALMKIRGVATFEEAVRVFNNAYKYLEKHEHSEDILKNVTEQWNTIHELRLQESLQYIKENYHYSEYQEGTRELYEERIEKAWVHYMNYVMSSQHSVNIKDVKIEIE